MTSSPVPLCFIDYLCAERGIEREYALELVGTYLITRSAAARGEPVDLDDVIDLNDLLSQREMPDQDESDPK